MPCLHRVLFSTIIGFPNPKLLIIWKELYCEKCSLIYPDFPLCLWTRTVNALLTKKHRKSAPLIAKTLKESCNFVSSKSVAETEAFVRNQIDQDENLDTEYFEIVNGDTLLPVDTWEESPYIVGCIAVLAGTVRLIDNIIYKKPVKWCCLFRYSFIRSVFDHENDVLKTFNKGWTVKHLFWKWSYYWYFLSMGINALFPIVGDKFLICSE